MKQSNEEAFGSKAFGRRANNQPIFKARIRLGIFLGLALLSVSARVPDLKAIEITGDYSPQPVVVGGKLTCAFTLYNEEARTASGTFTNGIPPSVVFVSATIPSGAFVASSNLFSYTPDPLGPGQQVVFKIVITPVTAQLITNVASWLGSTGDVIYTDSVIPVAPALPGPRMNVGRVDHNSTRLRNGSVLVTGGLDMTGLIVTTSTAEVYDPAANEFTLVGNMSAPRRRHPATVLNNGMVLVAGGYGSGSDIPISNVDLFDPINNVFIPTASLSVPRALHSATLLPNGDVILAGGAGASTLVERFHPANGLGTVSKAGNLLVPRSGHVAALLPSGEILFAGGADASYPFAEKFNPETGISVVVASSGHAAPAVAVARGTVLLHGWTIQPHFEAEVYDIESNSFSAPVAPPIPANGENYLTLDSGEVLITSGLGSYAANLFDPRTGAFTTSYPLAGTRWSHSAVQLADRRVLLTGGYDLVGIMSGDSRSTELYAIRLDQDQDGMDDAWELANGFDPTRREDAIEDADRDGFTNLQEYLAGTDPHDPNSFLRIEGAQQVADKLHIRFASVLGKFYNVERTSDLSSGTWVTVARDVAGTGSAIDISEPLMSGTTNQLYRVLVVP